MFSFHHTTYILFGTLCFPILIMYLFQSRIVEKHSKTFRVFYKLFCKYFFPTMPYKVPKTDPFDYPLPPFPNTWYPICIQQTIKSGSIYPFRIAGRDLVVYVDTQNDVHIQSRYCPHMGVDLQYGTIQKDCIICPFHHHCINPEKANTQIGEKNKQIYPCEVACGIIFVWIGPLTDNRPEYSIRQLFTEFYGNEQPSLCHSSFFERRVGGHLVDYAEHLLDITHAPYTHGVELEVVDNSLILKPHSFMVQFAIKNTSFRPKFTYITPTFGFVDYGFTMKTFIMFVVEDVGQIRMIQLPIVSGRFTDITGSIFAALYTHFDFTEEAAFFSTKCHLNRSLTKKESSMLQFREWFTETYYTTDERKRFREKQEFLKTITSW